MVQVISLHQLHQLLRYAIDTNLRTIKLTEDAFVYFPDAGIFFVAYDRVNDA
jgi:hypothetical protein